jgi:hypothetical protein
MPALQEDFGKAFFAHPIYLSRDEFRISIKHARLKFQLGIL